MFRPSTFSNRTRACITIYFDLTVFFSVFFPLTVLLVFLRFVGIISFPSVATLNAFIAIHIFIPDIPVIVKSPIDIATLTSLRHNIYGPASVVPPPTRYGLWILPPAPCGGGRGLTYLPRYLTTYLPAY